MLVEWIRFCFWPEHAQPDLFFFLLKILVKVLHIHRFGANGGSGGAISMRRLPSGLRKAGIESKILCVRDVKSSPHCIITWYGKAWPAVPL